MQDDSVHEKSLAAVGRKETVSLFRVLGAHVVVVETPDEAYRQTLRLKEERGEELAIIALEEGFYRSFNDEECEEVVAGELPAVLVVPGPEGESGTSEERLRILAEKAIGSDISI